MHDYSDLCEGHESLAGEHMGEAVYCDGTCSSEHPVNQAARQPAVQERARKAAARVFAQGSAARNRYAF